MAQTAHKRQVIEQKNERNRAIISQTTRKNMIIEQNTNYAYKLKYKPTSARICASIALFLSHEDGNIVEIVCPKMMILMFLKK